ncbi:N(4)-(Beta-N-acetylglucosaminyl)-L-asparaginase-like isoform X1 [Anopheles darlingi]|uniref:N(4)-(Beta-N-acetylglucosaminyl)-L-asparaginase- like isoform X1 n=1 Tax=Anopheles darlingi TaxID=43151 RepID=UPI0021000EBC|nr:N(4)-(Beta-N-acetylglucosaminyl)-L-asparaginase-like isoform X1 [Anopheles darlingi]
MQLVKVVALGAVLLSTVLPNIQGGLPLVVTTWRFLNATLQAYQSLTVGEFDPIDALVEGCSVCEREQCDGTVGYGGSPDETGETTLDAMLMDGTTMDIGAVAALREVKHAAAVAKYVLRNTRHTMLAGSQATDFALQMGFRRETLQTDESRAMWEQWKANHCQPNFWRVSNAHCMGVGYCSYLGAQTILSQIAQKDRSIIENVIPSPSMSCGPYEPVSANAVRSNPPEDASAPDRTDFSFGRYNHDTISMIVIDQTGHVVAGTSTNGARHKIPGRVGDSPIPGAGAYADSEVGAAVATGDGDVMMRFLPALLAVEGLRNGQGPSEAAERQIKRITKYYPTFAGGIVVATKDGRHGVACNGMAEFPYSVADGSDWQGEVKVYTVKCV